MPVAYTVTAAFPDPGARDRFVRWLLDGHAAAVVRSGAASAEIVRIDDPASPLSVEVRYMFPDLPAYQAYVADHAPRLRAEGLTLFPPSSGVAFSRRVGTILGTLPANFTPSAG